VKVGANTEEAAIANALADCGRQDRDCRVIGGRVRLVQERGIIRMAAVGGRPDMVACGQNGAFDPELPSVAW